MRGRRSALCLLGVAALLSGACNRVEPPPGAAAKAPPAVESFVDVTGASGIAFTHHSGAFGRKYLPETLGHGACFLDYDNDGWQDLLVVDSMEWPGQPSSNARSALYRNKGDGTFTEVTREAGLEMKMYGLGCTVADYDNDGHVDLYIYGVGANRLFRNLGNGKFADVTAKARVADPGFSTSAAWFDYDNDGRLDLLVAHYVEWSIPTDPYCSLDGRNKTYCTPRSFKGRASTLLRNKGDGTFENVTRRAGLGDAAGKSLGIALIDVDDDGALDVFIANDTEPNKLYRNNRDGTFRDVGAATGVAYGEAGTARAGMGTDAADFDNSGREGLVVGNFSDEGLALYRADGSGLFTDEAARNGMRRATLPSLTFAAFFFDFDLDGLLDVLAVNGHVSDDINVVQPHVKYAQAPHLFRNRGGGRFDEVTRASGAALQVPVVGRGAAYADIDNDGDLDLVIAANNGTLRLLRNDRIADGNGVLRVKLVGTRSNRDAVGAKVTVTAADGTRLARRVKTGSSYLSQSEMPLTFGLGAIGTAKSVTLDIAWPSGARERVADVKPNQRLTVQEGKGVVASAPIPRPKR